MSLGPQHLNSVVRITSVGDFLGSGSIVGVRGEDDPSWVWPFLVTAHHVVRSQIEIAVEIADPRENGVLFPPVAMDPGAWYAPIDGLDLAIAPFPFNEFPTHQLTPLEHFVPANRMPRLGAPVHYLGVFSPVDAPVCRTGALAAYDIPVDRNEFGNVYRYSAALLDCRSYKGFSGSACFATVPYAIVNDSVKSEFPSDLPPLPGGLAPELGRLVHEARFCGVLTSHYSDDVAAPDLPSRYGIGVMIPSDLVREALLCDRARKERRVMAQGTKPITAGDQA